MISGNLIAGESTIGGELKGAVATGEKFYLSGSATVVSFGEGYTGWMTEFGTGFFGSLGGNLFFDMSGGVGYGASLGDQFRKAYLQPAIGFRRDKFEFATGLKMSYINTKMDMSYWEEPQEDWVEEYTNNFIIEPFMLTRFGGDRTKFQIGVNFPTLIATDGFTMPTPNITVGAIIKFGGKK
jgi:hypothetical protein